MRAVRDLVFAVLLVMFAAGLVVAAGAAYLTWGVPPQTRTGLEGDY